MDSDGKNQRRLLRGFDRELDPQWSPDGTRLLFSTPSGVHVVTASGRNLERIAPKAREAAWAPDGRRVVLVSRGTRAWCTDLYVFDPPTRKVRRLTYTRTCEQSARWSPDGSWIAFVSASTDANDIVMVRPNGSGRRRVVRSAVSPSWSPDGRELAFASPGGIGILRLADGSVRELDLVSDDPQELVKDVSWSPDGSAFVFTKNELTPAKYGERLHRVSIDGTGDTLLTQGDGDYAPDWQPLP